MTRKIFIEGDRNGNRPNPVAALLLCLIPIVTLMYLKRRQRIQSGQISHPHRDNERQNLPEQGQDAADADVAKRKSKAEEEVMKKIKEEMDKLVQEKARIAAETQALSLEGAKLKEDQMKFDRLSRPNDPTVNDVPPIRQYDQLTPLSLNSTPPAKMSIRPYANGKVKDGYVQKKKRTSFIGDENEKPIDTFALYTGGKGVRGEPGFEVFEGKNYVGKDEKVVWDPKPERVGQSSDRSADLQELINTFKQKTEAIKEHLSAEDFAILQKSASAVTAKAGSREYEDAMAEAWHHNFGVYPEIAKLPCTVALKLLDESDAKEIFQGVERMRAEVKICYDAHSRLVGKSPQNFKARYCMESDPDREGLVMAWFFDSFRLVRTKDRMNVIRGAPVHMEAKLGKKFLILEWLERFGVLCARQRILSPRGFNLPGLCVRLHCLSSRNRTKPFHLACTLFMPGGPDKRNKSGKEMQDWEARFKLGAAAWKEIWGILLLENIAAGATDDTFNGFASREVAFCPGFTFEGLRQAGGLPDHAFPPRGPDPANPTRYEPILHDLSTQGFPYEVKTICGQRMFGQLIATLHPTVASFYRRRQYSWSTPSINDKSHDLGPGAVAVGLAILDPLSHAEPRMKGQKTNDLGGFHCIQSFRFGSTIPMTIDPNGIPTRFPDLTRHPNLSNIIMTYVPVSRDSSGNATRSKIPATAVLILSDQMGLKSLLRANRKSRSEGGNLEFWVDIKPEKIQQLADELLEELIKLAKAKHGSNWSGNIARDAKDDKEILEQVYAQHTDLKREPISGKIRW